MSVDTTPPARLTVSRDSWDDQFRSHRWDRLVTAAERARFAVTAAATPADAAVLDLGCAQAPLLDALTEAGWRGRYVGVDWSMAALRSARRRYPAAQLVCADLTTVALRGTFDLIFLGEVLYYLAAPGRVVERHRRWLAPGGRLCVTVYRPEAATPVAGHRSIAATTAVLRQLPGARLVGAAAHQDRRFWDIWEVRDERPRQRRGGANDQSAPPPGA